MRRWELDRSGDNRIVYARDVSTAAKKLGVMDWEVLEAEPLDPFNGLTDFGQGAPHGKP
jgi:hypothetical protein